LRVAIDTQGILGLNKERGIGRFGAELVREMLKLLHVRDEAVLVVNDNLSIAKFDAEVQNIFLPSQSAFRMLHKRYRNRVAEKIAQSGVDGICKEIFFVTHLFEGFADDGVCVLSSNDVNVVVLYDLIPLVMHEVYLSDESMRAWYFEKLELLKKADVVLCISEHSRLDAIRELAMDAKKLVTIGCDVDALFAKESVSEEKKDALKSRYGISEDFILYTGGIDKRKNINGLIEAYGLLPQKRKEKCQLVIVCSVSEAQKEEIMLFVQQLGINSERIIMSGYISDDELVALYNMCDLFVFASLYEGFGMPILEAMRCGAPVIGSNNSSIREIIEIEEAMFDPNNYVAMSQKIEEALGSEELREKLIKNSALQSHKYSIKKSALKSVQACREAVGTFTKEKFEEQTDKDMPKREKLAYVSPLPPEQTGIADYSAELLFEMVKYFDVTVITEQREYEMLRIPEGVEIKNSVWLKQNSDSFEKIIYHFGNSHFHAYMFELLEKCPGIVVSHDFYISGAVGWLDRFGGVHGAYADSLYYSHGYSALLSQKTDPKECGWKYPCNKEIMDISVGVITHSEFQKELAGEFYGDGYAKEWKCVAHLRVIKDKISKERAREKLGIGRDEFVICSFGFMGAHKLNEKALNAFLKSSLANSAKCQLIFVGAESGDAYCANILNTIEESGIKERVSITGFVDNERYEEYLAAMDIAVQLRTKSRGETSGTVLDVMANNRVVIINAHGTMNDYSEDICVKLEDEFLDEALTDALERLYEDKEYRDTKALHGHEYVKKYHNPELIGQNYKKAIDTIYENSWHTKYKKLMSEIGNLSKEYKAENEDLRDCAEAIAKNFCPQQQMQLFLDISELVKKDLKTGIQRVVRSLVSELIKHESSTYRVEPVYYENKTYKYARNFTSSLLQVAQTQENDCEIEYSKGDIFVGLDLSLEESVFAKERLSKMRAIGVKICFVVYDILPVLHKEWWPDGAFLLFSTWLKNVIEISDKLICISESTKRDVEKYMLENSTQNNSPIVEYFHLGADMENSISSSGITKEQAKILKTIDFKDSFLMVGTIEPRKGHAEVLKAFEILWSQGIDAKLFIIGKQGWMVEELIKNIKYNKELNKNLFWLSDASDEVLEILYAKCGGLLLASFGEGFGLPIIEAAKHNMPMLARDIEVFREVAQNGATYFKSNNASELALEIEKWLQSYREDKIIYPHDIKFLSWSDSAKWLENIVLH